jgi:hypothetical protein
VKEVGAPAATRDAANILQNGVVPSNYKHVIHCVLLYKYYRDYEALRYRNIACWRQRLHLVTGVQKLHSSKHSLYDLCGLAVSFWLQIQRSGFDSRR